MIFKVTTIFWDVTVCNLLADANLPEEPADLTYHPSLLKK
jgi:hypothetical protein